MQPDTATPVRVPRLGHRMKHSDRSSRVVESHRIARAALIPAAAFAVIAAIWGVVVVVTGGPWWGPLHAFLAGSVLLAISGTSQMFTITWSATAPPAHWPIAVQRWLFVVGTTAALVGVTRSIRWLVWGGGLLLISGLMHLGLLIVGPVRRSLLRRFDLSSRFYLTAFVAGVVGVSLGIVIATGTAGSGTAGFRVVHAHLNLIGLVGLTIIGTLPTLLPTTAYHRAVSGREATSALVIAIVGTAVTIIGLWDTRSVGVGTLLIATAGALVLGGILLRLWSRIQLKLASLQITIGTCWLIGWGFVDGLRLVNSGSMPYFSGWTAAVVVAGVGQVVAGAVAYLVPVLRGSPFVTNREIMGRRRWIPILSLNSAGVAVGLGSAALATLLLGLWLGDLAFRLLRVVAGQSTKYGRA